jgi:hypothetical protein
MKYVADNSNANQKLLFLAREGYMLEPLFRQYAEIMGKNDIDSTYFLTSRRAASVPTINTKEDIREILSQYYVGSLGNMLRSRLGCKDDIGNINYDLEVDSSKDLDMIMDMIRPLIPSILNRSTNERKLYTDYTNNMIGDKEDVAIVDLGYSGTTQYYLAKLLDKKISGYYVLTDKINLKPTKLGCTVSSMFEYSVDMTSKECLFLEGILQAPYGQFICFEKDGESVKEVYDENIYYPDRLKKMQESIVDYVLDTAKVLKDSIGKVDVDYNLCKALYLSLIEEDSFKDSKKVLNVQDSYCSDGTQVFDGNDWVVKEN